MIERILELCGNAADGWAADIAPAIDEKLVAPLAEHPRLRPLLSHVLNNLSERVSSEQAARIVNLETKYFSKFFDRGLGFNFSWWDREIRIRLATLLLHQKDRSVNSVALAVGYFDLTTFGRAFKKCVGIGPRAYRRSRISQQRPKARRSTGARAGVAGRPRDDKRRKKDEKRRRKDDERRLFRGDDADAKSVDSAGPPGRQIAGRRNESWSTQR